MQKMSAQHPQNVKIVSTAFEREMRKNGSVAPLSASRYAGVK